MRIPRRFIATLVFFIFILALVPPATVFARFTALPDFYAQDPDSVNPGSWGVDMSGSCTGITLSISQPSDPYYDPSFGGDPTYEPGVEYDYAIWSLEQVFDINDNPIPVNETGTALQIGSFDIDLPARTSLSNTFTFSSPLDAGTPFYATVRYTIYGGRLGGATGVFDVGDFNHPYWLARATGVGSDIESFCSEVDKTNAPTVSILGDYVKVEGDTSPDTYLIQLQLDKPSTKAIQLDLIADYGAYFPGTYTNLPSFNGYRVTETFDDAPCANEFDPIGEQICQDTAPDYIRHTIPAGQTYSEVTVYRSGNTSPDTTWYEGSSRFSIIRSGNAFIGDQETKKPIKRNDDGCNGFPGSECGFFNITPVGGEPDDRDQVSFTVANLQAGDVNPNSGVATFTVNLVDSTGAIANPYTSVVISYATNSTKVTTTPNVDYVASSGTITFNTGEATKTVDIPLLVDAPGDEDLEIFNVTFSKTSIEGASPLNADSVTVGAVIPDTAVLPVMTLAGTPSLSEGNSGTTNFTFTVNLSKGAIGSQIVNYAVTGTGTNPANASDFVGGILPSGSITIANGVSSGTITIPVNGDTDFEQHETFTLTISAGSTGLANGATLSRVGTINNDDLAPVNLFGVPPITESNAEINTIKFTVASPDGAVIDDQTVDYAVTASGANPVSADDFGGTLPSGTVTILDGESSVEIAIPYVNDAIVEPDETFTLTITPTGSGIKAGTPMSVTGTVTNDDSATVTIDDVSIAEGDSGTQNLTFTATVDNAVQGGFSVNYATSDDTATTADNDYDSTSGSLTFVGTSGETQTFDVVINGDTVVEANQSFTVTLSNSSNASVTAVDTATGTILNDDSTVISIDDVSQAENSGTFDFTVSLSLPSDSDVTVDYLTTGAPAAVADGDYDAIASTTLTFLAGETSKTVSVTVNDDSKVEADETFTVDLSNATGATIMDAQGVAEILNNDSASITIDDIAQPEGNSSPTTMTFVATLNGAVQGGVSVNYSTADGTATVADGDYATASGTLSFAGTAGETQSIVVTVNGDTVIEPDETFSVLLSGVTNSNIDVSDTATGTILNDEQGLLSNGGFEIAGDKEKYAEDWNASKLSLNNDRRKCNKDKTGDGIPDKIYSASGDCAFRFSFNETVILSEKQQILIHVIRRLRQAVLDPDVNAGDTLVFSSLVKANNLQGNVKLIVKVVYGPNRPDDVEKIKLVLDAGSYGYTQYTESLVLSRNPEKIVVLVKAGKSQGTFWIDDLNLTSIATSVVPMQTRTNETPLDLPEPPSSFRD